ncbi:MAG: hypothetical protein KC910_34980, partial [Candidatus Eremiobacteraeota bacterium]|nr:hypothetical protein [Candidatus Eremiobacteraeota bacterium]
KWPGSNRKEVVLHIRGATPGLTLKKPELPAARALIHPDPPIAKLDRPLLIVPGGNSRDWGLPAVIHYLCHGSENVYGGSFRVDALERLEETYQAFGGDVFSLEFTHEFGNLEDNAAEVARAVEAVKRVTGVSEIDLVAECKGAVETRKFLQDGGTGIRNFVQMVPPNHGMPVGGDLSSLIARLSVGLGLGIERLTFFPVAPDTLDTFDGMRTDISLGPLQWNPRLAALNRPEGLAKEQRAVHSTTILMGDRRPLVERKVRLGKLKLDLAVPGHQHVGDGSVPLWSAALPHAQHFAFAGMLAEHGRFPFHPKALAKMTEVLQSDGAPVHDQAYLAKPPTPTQAATLTALDVGGLAGKVNTLATGLGSGVFGPTGYVLAGLALVDCTHELAYQAGRKSPVGIASQTAQLGGVALTLAGHGQLGAALLGAGYLGGLLS